MSIIDRTLNLFGLRTAKQFRAEIAEAVKQELGKLPRWALETADAERYAIPDPIIYATQSDMYRLSPTLGTAMDVLMTDVGLTQFNVSMLIGEEKREKKNHEFEKLLRHPNELDSGLEFMRDTTASYKLNGNAVWWLNRADVYAKPDEIWNIPYEMVKPVPDGRMYISHYEYYPGNGKQIVKLPTWQIVHFKTYNPHSRFHGLSPIESLAITIKGNLGMRNTKTTQYTSYGGAPQSVLAFKDWINDEPWADIKREKRDAAMRNEMLMLRGTGEGVSWMSRTLSSKDAEFIENMKQDMVDIFNRMCPGLLAMLDPSATEANALAARATYAEKTLWPILQTIAQKVTKNVLPAYGPKLVGEFDDPRVVDRKLEMEEQKLFAETHTIGEIREEYYQHDPLGDERDNLLISQVNAQSGGIQKPPPNPFDLNSKQPPQLPDGEDVIDAPAEEMPVMENEAEDVQAKAAIDELKRWRRMVKRGRLDGARAFTSGVLPNNIMQTIKARLASVTDTDTLLKMFDNHIERMKPQPKVSAEVILKGIELGVKALEVKAGKA